VRRKQFRQILDSDTKVIKSFIRAEQERRKDFYKNVHTYLPSAFCPQLRDNVADLVIESGSESSFPDVSDAVKSLVPLQSPFSSFGSQEEVKGDMKIDLVKNRRSPQP